MDEEIFVICIRYIAQSVDLPQHISTPSHLGPVATAAVERVSREIEKQLQLPISEIPEASQFLLEIPREELESSHPVEQSYWLLTVQAARKAGQRVANRIRRRKRRGLSQGTVPPPSSSESPAHREKRSRISCALSVACTLPVRLCLGKRRHAGAVDDPLYKRRKPD